MKKRTTQKKGAKAYSVSEVSRELGIPRAPEKGLLRRAPLIPTIRNVLFAPHLFFEKIGHFSAESGIVYLLLISAFPAVWIFGANVGFLGGIFPAMQAGAYGYLFIILSSAISAGIAHLALKAIGGKGKLSETMNSFFFGGTPWFLLSSVPIASFFGLFWSIYLESLGIAKAHGIGKFRAILGILVPLLIFVGALALFVQMNPEIARQILEEAGRAGNYSSP